MNPKFVLTCVAVVADIDTLCIAANPYTPTVVALGDILGELASVAQWPLFFAALGVFIFSLKELRKQPRQDIDFVNALLSFPMVAYGLFNSCDLFK
jgi:hypothetical protein